MTKEINISKDDAIEILWAIDRAIGQLWDYDGNPLHARHQIKTLGKVRENIRDQVLSGVTND
jgi:hypothetical protein